MESYIFSFFWGSADEDGNDEKVDAKIEAKRLRKSERKEQKRLHAKEQRCEGFT